MKGNERAEAEFARRLARQEVTDRLRELASNIIRVVRGAGISSRIAQQAQSLIDAMAAYRETVGHWPSAEELDEALDIEVPSENRDRMNEIGLEISYATQAAIRGALQIAASRLVNQRPREAAGEAEMHQGISDLERAREQRRKQFAAILDSSAKPSSPAPGAGSEPK